MNDNSPDRVIRLNRDLPELVRLHAEDISIYVISDIDDITIFVFRGGDGEPCHTLHLPFAAPSEATR
jgi:hypothetical protein